MSDIQLTVDFSPEVGHLCVYVHFRQGKAHETIELEEGIVVDVDREGRALGVEIVNSLPPMKPGTELTHSGGVNLTAVQAAVEKHFDKKFDLEFSQARAAFMAVK